MMKQKAELQAKKACFDADLHLLQSQRAAAAAFQEVENESGAFLQHPVVEEEPLTTVQRTTEYVQHHFSTFPLEQPLEPAAVVTPGRKIDRTNT